jgi:hypothetical protein
VRWPSRVERGVSPALQLQLQLLLRRKRLTPPSRRYLGRRVYLATVVTLISAMLHGTTPARLARLSDVPGINRPTLVRWLIQMSIWATRCVRKIFFNTCLLFYVRHRTHR